MEGSISVDTIGGRIRRLRENLSMTQVALAQAVGITKMTLSKYEHDQAEPRGEIIAKLADVLDTTADYLLGRTTSSAPLVKNKVWMKLSLSDSRLLEGYHLLDPANRIRVMEHIEVLLEDQRNQAVSGNTEKKRNN